MSQERWDVVLRFVSGPLSYQGEIVVRGPVVRMGANPGPGGLRLEGYRGLDDRQAVISAYDGGTVSIAPVGTNQVRVAPHENVDWGNIQLLRGPVYLSPGDAFHLGSPGRGCTAIFVEARRLGVWEEQRILSEAADAAPGIDVSKVRNIDTAQGRPKWFIPALLVSGMFFSSGIMLSVLKDRKPPIPKPGPTDKGQVYYERVNIEEVPELPPEFKDGLAEGLRDFVMKPNATAARYEELARDPARWDPKFVEYVRGSVALHARGWAFWKRLEAIKDDYAYVVSKLKDDELPTVLAAIPFQESQYNNSAQSYTCAKGAWQFMPETAVRAGLRVSGCKLRGSEYRWEPERETPVHGVVRNAKYIERGDNGYRCRIQRCDIDERGELAPATDAAIYLLREPWDDPEIADSGAAIQITILSHNAGWDDSRYDEPRKKPTNLRWAYRKHLKRVGRDRDPHFYGRNITCEGKEWADPDKTNKRCGGVLPNQTQHYAYNIVAQHLLAVCYYGLNHATDSAFDGWNQYWTGDGYCNNIGVPQSSEVFARGGG